MAMMPVKPPKIMPPPPGTYSPSAKAQKIIGAQKSYQSKAPSDLMRLLGSKNVPGTGGPNYPVGPLGKRQTTVPGTGGPNFPIPGGMKKGGSVKKYKAGGSVKSSSPMKSSASKRADGCAIKGKTRGRIV